MNARGFSVDGGVRSVSWERPRLVIPVSYSQGIRGQLASSGWVDRNISASYSRDVLAGGTLSNSQDRMCADHDNAYGRD